MEFLLDPGIWVGLITLIILEIVLGIDNLVFIAIMTEKIKRLEKKYNSKLEELENKINELIN